MEGHKISLSGRCRRRMEGVGASEGNWSDFHGECCYGVCLNLSWCLEALFPRGAFYLRRRSRSIVSNRLGSRCRSKRSPRLAQVQESGGTSREARDGGGLALKRSTMIDAIANRNAATRDTAIRDHIPISSQALLGAVDYAPLAHGDVSVRPDLLCGNEVISQCKTHDEDQLSAGARRPASPFRPRPWPL